MNKTIVQVPVSVTLRDQAAAIVQNEWGLSSLQEALRLHMRQIVNRTIHLTTSTKEPPEFLTPKQEAILTKQYHKIQVELKSGQGLTSSSADELMNYLNSHDDSS
jgi:hypothetical protein